MPRILPRIFDRYLMRRTRSLRAVTRAFIRFLHDDGPDDAVVFADQFPAVPPQGSLAVVEECRELRIHPCLDATIHVQYHEKTEHLPLAIYQSILCDQHRHRFHLLHPLAIVAPSTDDVATWGVFDMEKLVLPRCGEIVQVGIDGQWLQICLRARGDVTIDCREISASLLHVHYDVHETRITVGYDLSKDESQRVSCLILQRCRSQQRQAA